MTKYQVEFSYNYEIEATDREQAQELAIELFEADAPLADEMNIEITTIE